MKSAVKAFIALTLGSVMAIGPVTSAISAPFSTVTIRNDRGGYVINYALKMKRMERDGKNVRFAGPCDSACTLFLALPKSKTCVMPGASFGFHLPYGSSRRGNRFAADYLLSSYPGWVRSWLRDNGGLTSRIKVMNYNSIRGHLPACETRQRFVSTFTNRATDVGYSGFIGKSTRW